MAISDLVPSLWRRGSLSGKQEREFPIFSLQRDLNRLFDDFFRGFDVSPFGLPGERLQGFYPSVDVEETDRELIVRMDLPGLEEKDVELLLTDDALTVKGEKKQEAETKEKGYHQVERSYGAFERVIPLPAGIESQKAAASFKNGVLTVRIARTEAEKAKGKRIPIKAA